MELPGEKLRPAVVREIALWWHGRLDEATHQADVLPESPSLPDIMQKFRCSEDEALRGLCLGEYRHFGSIE
jgi:hypothetical protein